MCNLGTKMYVIKHKVVTFERLPPVTAFLPFFLSVWNQFHRNVFVIFVLLMQAMLYSSPLEAFRIATDLNLACFEQMTQISKSSSNFCLNHSPTQCSRCRNRQISTSFLLNTVNQIKHIYLMTKTDRYSPVWH